MQISSSPMLRDEDGGIVNTVLLALVSVIGVVAVAEVARVVVVQQIVVALLAARLDRRGAATSGKSSDRSNAGLRFVGAVRCKNRRRNEAEPKEPPP